MVMMYMSDKGSGGRVVRGASTDAQRPGGRSGVANNTGGISKAISRPSVNVV